LKPPSSCRSLERRYRRAVFLVLIGARVKRGERQRGVQKKANHAWEGKGLGATIFQGTISKKPGEPKSFQGGGGFGGRGCVRKAGGRTEEDDLNMFPAGGPASILFWKESQFGGRDGFHLRGNPSVGGRTETQLTSSLVGYFRARGPLFWGRRGQCQKRGSLLKRKRLVGHPKKT